MLLFLIYLTRILISLKKTVMVEMRRCTHMEASVPMVFNVL